MDSLEPNVIPRADLILMNPPFISWARQDKKQRAQLLSIVGKSASSRGDLSMAFVNRAIEALTTNGVLGTLFPASLLSQRAAEGWRRNLVEGSRIRLLGSMGDYGLFTHALVQIACAVFTKDVLNDRDVTALVAGNQARATGDALRALRRISVLPPAIPVVGDQWSVFGLTPADLKSRPTWRLRQPLVEASFEARRDAPAVRRSVRGSSGRADWLQPGLSPETCRVVSIAKAGKTLFPSGDDDRFH